MTSEIRYSDLDMNFRINPNTGDLVLKINDDAIKQHIRLLFTDDGLLFKPESRSGINIQLFDSWNQQTRYIVERQIREHLSVYEPRIEILNLSVDFEYNTQAVDIKLNYKIQEELQELNFSFLVTSIR